MLEWHARTIERLAARVEDGGVPPPILAWRELFASQFAELQSNEHSTPFDILRYGFTIAPIPQHRPDRDVLRPDRLSSQACREDHHAMPRPVRTQIRAGRPCGVRAGSRGVSDALSAPWLVKEQREAVKRQWRVGERQ